MSEGSRYLDWDMEKLTAHFDVDPAEGLEDTEAEKRKEKVGPNQLAEGKRLSPLALLLNQFKDFMVLVLLAATLISGLLGNIPMRSPSSPSSC